MEAADKSSILLSIFRRKGAEGLNTKIIGENNQVQYRSILSALEADERGLVICYWDEFNWVILTNRRLIVNEGGTQSIINNSQISEVSPALQEEYKNGITNKNLFTLIKIKDMYDKVFIVKLEMGSAYEGFYQVLHYVVCNNER